MAKAGKDAKIIKAERGVLVSGLEGPGAPDEVDTEDNGPGARELERSECFSQGQPRDGESDGWGQIRVNGGSCGTDAGDAVEPEQVSQDYGENERKSGACPCGPRDLLVGELEHFSKGERKKKHGPDGEGKSRNLEGAVFLEEGFAGNGVCGPAKRCGEHE